MTNVIRLSTSRTFMVRQAVLNAAQKHWPWGIQHYGVAEVLRRVEQAQAFQFGFFIEQVCQEYLILSGVYRETPDCDFTDDDFAFAADIEAAGARALL